VFLIFGIGFVDERGLGKFTRRRSFSWLLSLDSAAMYFCISALAKEGSWHCQTARLRAVSEDFPGLYPYLLLSHHTRRGDYWMRYASLFLRLF
jgi:hypothetical protein